MLSEEIVRLLFESKTDGEKWRKSGGILYLRKDAFLVPKRRDQADARTSVPVLVPVPCDRRFCDIDAMAGALQVGHSVELMG